MTLPVLYKAEEVLPLKDYISPAGVCLFFVLAGMRARTRFMLIQDICQATYIKCVPYFSCFLIHASAQLIIYNSFIKQFAVQMWWKLVLVTNDFLYYICDGVSVLFEMHTVGKVDEMVISLYCLSNWKMNSLWRSWDLVLLGVGKMMASLKLLSHFRDRFSLMAT